jgi:predicted transcriptional regulator
MGGVNMSVRTTIQIEAELLTRLRQLVPARGLSRFVNEAVAEKIAAIERREIEAAMIEGYRASADEQRDVHDDWRSLDVESWPE